MAQATTSPASAAVAAAPATKKSTNFFDLPPEIRNDIYTMALSSPEPLRILVAPVLKLICNRKPGTRTNGQLLRVCRKVNAEATPILYGANDFEFSLGSDIEMFFIFIGERRHQIRNITIKRVCLIEVRLAFDMLSSGNKLQRVELAVEFVRSYDTKCVVAALLPGLQGRCKALESTTAQLPDDIFHFFPADGCDLAGTYCASEMSRSLEDRRRDAETYTRVIRQALGAALDS